MVLTGIEMGLLGVVLTLLGGILGGKWVGTKKVTDAMCKERCTNQQNMLDLIKQHLDKMDKKLERMDEKITKTREDMAKVLGGKE